MEMSGQIHVSLPLGKGRCGKETNLIFLPGLVLWIVWPIAYSIFSFIISVYQTGTKSVFSQQQEFVL
jgi:hypothetical protein